MTHMIQLLRPSRGHTTQPYGNVIAGVPHAGEDYAYTDGVRIFPEVYAAADGVVLFAGDSRGLAWPNIMYLNVDFDRSDNVDSSAGNYIILAHDAGGVRIALTGYGHLENVHVRAGDRVTAGQRIGTVGETGNSRGKHLHFDLVIAPFAVSRAPYYGRVDPKPFYTTAGLNYAGTTQTGTTTTTTQEDDDLASAAESINANIHTVHMAVIGVKADVATVHETIIRDVGGQLAGLREALRQVSAITGVPVDLDAIERASRDGAQAALERLRLVSE